MTSAKSRQSIRWPHVGHFSKWSASQVGVHPSGLPGFSSGGVVVARRVISPSTWTHDSRCCSRMDALPGHVCAIRRDQRSQGSDSAGGCRTTAACRAGLGRSPICMSCTTRRLALPRRRPAAVRAVGSSPSQACRSAGSGNGSMRRHVHAEPYSPPDRAAASRSSAGKRRAAPGRGGRCRPRSSGRPTLNHRPALKQMVRHAGRDAFSDTTSERGRQRVRFDRSERLTGGFETRSESTSRNCCRISDSASINRRRSSWPALACPGWAPLSTSGSGPREPVRLHTVCRCDRPEMKQ